MITFLVISCFVVALAFVLGNISLILPFLILAIILAFFIFLRNKEISSQMSEKTRDKLHITNLDVGGIIKLSRVGTSMEEYTLKVLAKHLYREGDFYWYEFECDKGDGDKIWLEVEDDDETVVSMVLEKMKLKDINTTSEELAYIDDEESGQINYKNKVYHYDDSSSATFYRNCLEENAEKFYYWEFYGGNLSISVEKWGESSYEVYLTQNIRPDQITVLANRTGQ